MTFIIKYILNVMTLIDGFKSVNSQENIYLIIINDFLNLSSFCSLEISDH